MYDCEQQIHIGRNSAKPLSDIPLQHIVKEYRSFINKDVVYFFLHASFIYAHF